jgi:hypothetical protein
MQESLTPEHSRELISDTLEQLLNTGGVTNKGRAHLQPAGRDRAESGLHVVGDPLNEVGRVLVLDVAHLVLDLLHRDLTTEDGRASQITTVTEVRCGHHVLRVVHLLGELWYSDGTEGMGSPRSERGESDHEEMKTREGNHVDGQFAQIRVELTRETQTGGNTRHDGRDKVVQVSIRWGSELKGSHANVVKSLVIDTKGLIGVLNCRPVRLMDQSQ